MKLEGSYRFDVSRKDLWSRLMDPEAVAACMPGCRKLTPLAVDRFEVVLQVGIGAISGSYTGTVSITDKEEPASYRMTVEGKGARTTISGTGTVTLAEAGDGSDLRFEGEANVTGMLARVGQRLIGTVARAQIKQFFECMRSKDVVGPLPR